MENILLNIAECIHQRKCFEEIKYLNEFLKTNCENIGFYGIIFKHPLKIQAQIIYLQLKNCI